MKKVLIVKNKFKFVDGSLMAPDSFDPSGEAFERCNNLVHSWILNSVSPSIAQSIMHIESASRCWKILKDSQGNSMCVAELKVELYHLKQGNMSVTDFFTHMSTILEEIATHRPTPACICPVKCACDAIHEMVKYNEDDAVIRFVTGLNESFSMIKSQILMMDPLPPLNRAFSLVVQFETQNGLC